MYPAAKKYLKIKEIWKPPKPKAICMFFVKDEVLVEFRIQNLEGIKMHGIFLYGGGEREKENTPREVNWKSNNPVNLNLWTHFYLLERFTKVYINVSTDVILWHLNPETFRMQSSSLGFQYVSNWLLNINKLGIN